MTNNQKTDRAINFSSLTALKYLIQLTQGWS